MLSNLGRGWGWGKLVKGCGEGGGGVGVWEGGVGWVGEEKQQEERDKCGKVHQSSQWFTSHPPDTQSTHLSLCINVLILYKISQFLKFSSKSVGSKEETSFKASSSPHVYQT